MEKGGEFGTLKETIGTEEEQVTVLNSVPINEVIPGHNEEV